MRRFCGRGDLRADPPGSLLLQMPRIPDQLRAAEQDAAGGQRRQSETIAAPVGMEEPAAVIVAEHRQYAGDSEEIIEKIGHACELLSERIVRAGENGVEQE